MADPLGPDTGVRPVRVIQAVVRKSTIVRLMGDDRPRTPATASLLGGASSSCSYAAVALARSLVRKGADFTAAMAFEIGSTNLVIEMGVILALLMGWQFTAAEFVGGPLMIIGVAVLFRLFVRKRLVAAAREQADGGLAGSMEGHASMDMSVDGTGSFISRLLSPRGFTAVSGVFVMEWAAILRDLPILNIYRKYYGTKMALVLLGTFYAAMVAAGYLVELLFGVTGLIPAERSAKLLEAGISWNYTTWLNIAFLTLAAAFVIRFLRTGGRDMLTRWVEHQTQPPTNSPDDADPTTRRTPPPD